MLVASAKRYSAEQIVAKLRGYEKLQRQGLTVPQACTRIRGQRPDVLAVADEVWGLKEDDAQWLKPLEQENGRSRRIVAEQPLDIAMLEDLNRRA